MERGGKRQKHFIQAKTPEKKIIKTGMKTKNSRKTFPLFLNIKSKTHSLARQRDRFKKGICPTHPTGKEETYSGLPYKQYSVKDLAQNVIGGEIQ